MSKKYNINIKRLPEHKLNYANLPLIKNNNKNTVDLRNYLPDIVNQGQTNSCTANAIACLINYLNNNLKNVSRLFLYYNERLIENCINEDAGAYISDGILSLITFGICEEEVWPYELENLMIKPSNKAYVEALCNKALIVKNIPNTFSAMINALNNNYPFVVGIEVYDSFEDENVQKTGIVPYPNTKREILLGGHAIVCVGYDSNKKLWIMRNSWGTEWGDKGYFYIPLEYLLNDKFTSELWIIQKICI